MPYRTYGRRRRLSKEKMAKKVATLFDPNAKDLSYITENKELLKAHITFINRCVHDRAGYRALEKYAATFGPSKGRVPKAFEKFSTNYSGIYELWVHLIKSCGDPNYITYPFFGAKGIFVAKEFLDGKKFCIWCLKNGFTGSPFTYDKYLQRINKSKKYYSSKNCCIISEKELHECKSTSTALKMLWLVKRYEESHDPSVSFMAFYTRYFIWDFDADDAANFKYEPKNYANTFGFLPVRFYEAVATEESCPMSVFISRMHYSYLNGGFIARPYDMLKPEYSVSVEANKQNKVSYKQMWERQRKEEKKNKQINNDNNDVYNSNGVESTYDENNSVYS